MDFVDGFFSSPRSFILLAGGFGGEAAEEYCSFGLLYVK
jgi:hypothetical protein